MIQILAGKAKEKQVDFVLTGENVEAKTRYNKDTMKEIKIETGNLMLYNASI